MTMRRLLRFLVRDERGGPLAEFALVIGLLFVVALFVFEMTRFFTQAAMAEYATHLAARIAAVRPAVCPGLPDFNERVNGSPARFGTMCSAPSAPCAAVATQTCAGAAGNAVVDEIFGIFSPCCRTGPRPRTCNFATSPRASAFSAVPTSR
jgi:Flp pilus assembly pilin Flp